MSELEDLIRHALREDEALEPEPPGVAGRMMEAFLRRRRWVSAFAGMKMSATLAIALFSALAFFAAESTRAQIAWATLCLVGFVGFATWWIWYAQVSSRAAVLRELKHIELQLAELRASR